MVFLQSFLSSFRLNPHRVYKLAPTKLWRRRRIMQLSSHFFGRRRNCWRLAVQSVQRALLHAAQGRKNRKMDMMILHGQRASSASEELGLNFIVLKRGLESANVVLDNHSLADLSIWEPRTFQALGNFAWKNYHSRGFGDIENLGNPPEGVILRGMKK